jgi:DNA-binding transcriptional ArsR family regulator
MSSDRADPTDAGPSRATTAAADTGPGGWTPVEGVGEPAEVLELDAVDLLAEATHPVRSRIMRALRRPRTVAEVAKLLDVPVTRLYHHVNRLEDLGFVRVVATRRVAAVTERRYQVVAMSMRLAPELFESSDRRELAMALGSLFDLSKHSLQREIEHGDLADWDSVDNGSVLSHSQIVVSPERRAELAERLQELLDEFTSNHEEDESEGERIELFVALFPTAR